MRPIPVERFSTDATDPAARLAYWNELASETFNNLTVDARDRSGFRGEMVRAPIGELTLMSADSAPASVSRTSDALRSAGGLKAFDLHFQLAGRSLNAQDGREALLETGDFTLCDASRPYRVSFDEPNHMLCLKAPAQVLVSRLGDVESLLCVPMSARSAGASMLSSFLRSVWRELQDGEVADQAWAETVSSVILDLMALAYRPLRPGASDASRRAVRRREAHALIEQRLCDPELDVGQIAAALGISARYLQLLFAEDGATPSGFIQDRRLQLAAERLRGGVDRGGVTHAALSVGFNDVTHFGRAFRRRFGVSPSDYAAGLRAARWQAL